MAQKKVKSISVEVTYRVGLGDFKVAMAILQQLKDAEASGDTIEVDSAKYPDAANWLTSAIRERDCFHWHATIGEIVE